MQPGWPSLDVDYARKTTGEKLLYWLRQDGFEWVNGRLVRSVGTPDLADLVVAAYKLEGTHLALQIQRMKGRSRPIQRSR